MAAALSRYFWSWFSGTRKSPLQAKLSDIQMLDLAIDVTPTVELGSFGVVTKLKQTNKDKNTVPYLGRKLPEAPSDVPKAMLEMFPERVLQLRSLRHSSVLQMQGVFFSDNVYLPTLVYEHLWYEEDNKWKKLECFLSINRSEVDKIAILDQVASGLEYLHNQKPPVLHLNLSVVNIMVCQDDPNNLPLVKITDAGIVSLVNVGRSTLIQPQIVKHLPEEEKSSELTAKVDVLCYGLVMGHVVLQMPIIKILPILWDDDNMIDKDSDACQLHEWLEIHPLYPIMIQCLKKDQQSRPTASDIKEQIQSHKDGVFQWKERIQTQVMDWAKNSSTLDIMITGKTGSGKTSLINGLIGAEVGREGDMLDRGTTEVEAKEFVLQGKIARIYDTPGLQDGTDEEERYLEDMKRCCSDCDLYIYCMKMTQTRFEAGDKRAFEGLTEAFGTQFWTKVLFALTFANSPEVMMKNKPDCDKEDFEEKVKMWQDKIVKELIKVGVEQEVAKAIEVVPTGYHRPLKYSPDCWVLPGIPNWFENFWYKCVEAMEEKALPALIAFNYHRLKAPEDITEEDLKNPQIEEQPIPIRGRIAAVAGLAVAGAGVGAGAGAGIGAALGSIVFSLAGPVGVAGGAVVGGAVGAAVIDPIVVSLYWKYSAFKKSRSKPK